MLDPGAGAGLAFMANQLLWVRRSGSGGHVVLKAMGIIVAAMA